MRQKVSIIGAGNVGATMAMKLAEKDFADIILVDIIEGMPQGKGLDITQTGPIDSYDTKVIGTNSYTDTQYSDIVIITAGVPRKPGMSRDDLLEANYNIVKPVTEQVAQYSPNAILIIVANPLDAMAQLAYKTSGFSKSRVMGMAGILDTARFRTFIAMELNVSVEDVYALVLGGHGDTMVPLVRYSTVAGVPLPEILSKEKLDMLIQRTRNSGMEIVKLLKAGGAYYAPASAAVQMVEAIILNKKRILPCAAYLEGEYGINGLFVGVPIKLGANGIEEIIQLRLTPEENAALKKSAATVEELIKIMEKF
ncbi:malate dehydrogenase [bacterium Unc6]|nr:malate dehydrogenase [bacterium Unc6]